MFPVVCMVMLLKKKQMRKIEVYMFDTQDQIQFNAKQGPF